MSPPAPPSGLPRLLAGLPAGGTVALGEHVERWGPAPHAAGARALRLIEVVEHSGLRGRGGAGFPTGRKLRAVAERSRRPVVVVNGTEGEPASAKDALLLLALPHLVLEGAVLAAQAVGAEEVIVCVDRTRHDVAGAVSAALADRASHRLGPVPVRVAAAPPRFVSGEETALVNWLNAREAKPTSTPPRPFQKGVGGRPTLVQNVETLAHLALIARFGPDWFRELGTEREPGTMLATVSGAVFSPGVVEIALGAPFADAIDAAGGLTCDVEALLVGGYFGSWIPAEQAWCASLSQHDLGALGAGLGAGVIVALPADACGLAETSDVVAYLASESARQCGPCLHGLAALAGDLARLAAGERGGDQGRRLERWAGEVRGRGGCHHPDGASRLIVSALRVFTADVAHHHARGACARERRPRLLPLPDHVDRGWR